MADYTGSKDSKTLLVDWAGVVTLRECGCQYNASVWDGMDRLQASGVDGDTADRSHAHRGTLGLYRSR